MESWVGVELRHLVALEAVHEERSFRGAADRLDYVQSAVSQQISHLERLVGERLVDRIRGQSSPVALTDAGLLVLGHSRTILGQVRAAQADLRALTSGQVRRLRVGVLPSVATRLLPQILPGLGNESHPIAVDIEEASSDRDQFALVSDGALDAAFAELPLDEGPFEALEVLEDPCVLVVPADDPMALREEPPTLEDIANRDLIAVEGWGMMELVEAHLRRVGEPEFVLRVNSNASAQALVGAGLGAAVLPRLAVHEGDAHTTFLDLSGLLPARRLALYWLEGRQYLGALHEFATAALAAAKTIERSFAPEMIPTLAPVPEPALVA